MLNQDESIPDRLIPGLPTTTSGVARQDTCGNYVVAGLSENKRRKRGGRHVRRQWELWKGRRTVIRVGNLNIETMNGKGREVALKEGAKENSCTVPTGNKVKRE